MRLRLLGTGFAAALALAAAPAIGLVAAPVASAAGDVCDICSVNFDLRLCEQLGGWAYDSTQEPAPPAVGGGQQPAPPQQPAPQQPAPQQPAPQQPGSQNRPGAPAQTGPGSAPAEGSSPHEVATTDAGAPGAPTGLASSVEGRTLTLRWEAPADGGAPVTAYRLVLNGGTPIELPASSTSYEIDLAAGTYEVALFASNAVGDSPASQTLTGIEVGPSPSPSESAGAVLASAAAPASDPTPLVGGLVLGGLVLAGGGLLTWWWLRRRATTAAPATPAAS